MNPDTLATMPDTVSGIVEPLAAISPLLGVIAIIAIAIVVYLYRENKKKDELITKKDDQIIAIMDSYNQTQMANLETLKDVAHIVDRSTETIQRAENEDRERMQSLARKVDEMLLAVKTCSAPRQ